MPTRSYDNDAKVAALEAKYRGRDVEGQRRETLRRLAIQPGERVLDIGSGPGFLASEIASQTGPRGHVLGIDASALMVRSAEGRNDQSWLEYREGDALALPAADATFDVAVSTQVAEYMPDLAAYCAEIARVLKPGGRALVLTTDWEGIAWHSEFPDRMARVLNAQSTSVVQTNVPRILAPFLRGAGLTDIEVGCHRIINLDRSPGSYSRGTAEAMAKFIRLEGTMDDDDLTAWTTEQDALEAAGRYFFSIGRYIFQARKPT